MRQVNRDELIHIIKDAMRGWTKGLHKEMQHYDPTSRLRGLMTGAGIIADKLERLEILSSAPAPAPFRYPALGDPGYNRDEVPEPSPNPFEGVGSKSVRP